MPEVAKEEAGLLATVSVRLIGGPDSAFAQSEQAPEQDEHQRDQTQPKSSPPHS